MSTTIKECSQCGGPNDIIASKCGFCHNDLPLAEDELDNLSDDKLIGSASKWTALHVESIGNDFISQQFKTIQRQSQRGAVGNLKAMFKGDADFKAADGRIANYTPEEIRINATKSLSLLLSRAARNSAIMGVYSQLKQDIESAENRKRTRMIYIVAGVAIMIIGVIVLDIVIVIATSLEGAIEK